MRYLEFARTQLPGVSAITTADEKIRVLFVDDDDPLRLTARLSLGRKGFEVDIRDSGEGAVEALKEATPDVVVLDYSMPGMTGLNVLQWMHEQKLEVPVVMLTAAGTEQIAVEAMKLGAYDYIRKEHMDLDHLALIIRGVHERHLFRRERALREQIRRDRENMQSSAEMFEGAMNSLTHIVNSELTLIDLNISEVRQFASARLTPEERLVHLTRLSDELTKAYSTVSSAVRSMLSLASALKIKLSAEDDSDRVEQLLQAVQKLQEEYSRTKNVV